MSPEAFLRSFHAIHPGVTSTALARSDSYLRLADRVPAGARVLDLGCGDGHLARLLAARGCRAVGLDISPEELALARRPPAVDCVRARAQALPFAGASFDAVVAHLTWMLLHDLPAVVAELHRVLAPGGTFTAVLGGGPTAGGHDAFHAFLALLAAHGIPPVQLGDRRARSEAGWHQLFAGWRTPPLERHVLDLGGSFDDVWRFLGASYELPPDPAATAAIRDELRARLPGDRIRCDVVIWLAQATR